jgi:hypothetical protein
MSVCARCGVRTFTIRTVHGQQIELDTGVPTFELRLARTSFIRVRRLCRRWRDLPTKPTLVKSPFMTRWGMNEVGSHFPEDGAHHRSGAG